MASERHYNGLGQRTYRFHSSAPNFVIISAYDEAGQPIGQYTVDTTTGGVNGHEVLYLEGIPVAIVAFNDPPGAGNTQGFGPYYLHPDHLDTPRLVTDVSNQVLWRWDLGEPFGNSLPNENPSGLGTFGINYRFPGQYLDRASNTHYNYFRDYDPATGRYPQFDLIGLNGGINGYAYALNNPLRFTDPLGLATWSGTSYQIGLIDRVGGTYTLLDLWSECRCNRKYHILVHAPGVAVSLGIKASFTITNVSFDDGTGCPDPTAFLGAYLSVNAGATVGAVPIKANPRIGFGLPGIGASVGISRYGDVTSSIDSPVGTTVGRDLSVSGSIGLTFMNVLEVKDCCR